MRLQAYRAKQAPAPSVSTRKTTKKNKSKVRSLSDSSTPARKNYTNPVVVQQRQTRAIQQSSNDTEVVLDKRGVWGNVVEGTSPGALKDIGFGILGALIYGTLPAAIEKTFSVDLSGVPGLVVGALAATVTGIAIGEAGITVGGLGAAGVHTLYGKGEDLFGKTIIEKRLHRLDPTAKGDVMPQSLRDGEMPLLSASNADEQTDERLVSEADYDAMLEELHNASTPSDDEPSYDFSQNIEQDPYQSYPEEEDPLDTAPDDYPQSSSVSAEPLQTSPLSAVLSTMALSNPDPSHQSPSHSTPTENPPPQLTAPTDQPSTDAPVETSQVQTLVPKRPHHFTNPRPQQKREAYFHSSSVQQPSRSVSQRRRAHQKNERPYLNA
jgi:hypothetical protein